jgi:penicillin amidase
LELASQVTIHRDEFGVPHIVAETDAAALFGSLFAQAEDNFTAVEDSYLAVLGRLGEKQGAGAFWSDLAVRALELPRLAQDEYERAAPQTQDLCRSAAAGLNFYVASRPQAARSIIRQFLPWHIMGLYRLLHLAAFQALGIQPAEFAAALHWIAPGNTRAMGGIDASFGTPPVAAGASSAWAIAPERSTKRTAMLLSISHVPFGSLYELHLVSKQGLNFTGAGFWGMPLPMLGLNPQLGWGLTMNRAAVADLFVEAFERKRKKRTYRHGRRRKEAIDWTEVLRFTASGGLKRLRLRFRKTDHGPIVAIRYGKPIAAQIARLTQGGLMQQLLSMAKATSFRGFRKALKRLSLISHNVLYADAQGNIFYLYNGAVPRRPSGASWPVLQDGSDPGTDWNGYHVLSELPQLLNPPGGFLQNCNSSPFCTCETGNPDPTEFPPYLRAESDNARARASRAIAQSVQRFSLSGLEAAAFNTTVFEAEHLIRELCRQWELMESRDRRRARRTARAMAVLKAWRRKSSEQSVTMTVFARWLEAVAAGYGGTGTGWPMVVALERALEGLRRVWGRWELPWGQVNRLQRPSRPGEYKDAKPSLPIAGGPSVTNIPFAFDTVATPGQRCRYGVFGNGFVFVAEFGKKTTARSILVFGQNADPLSPHYFDQATLYRGGQMKSVHLNLAEVEAHGERVYSPAQLNDGSAD